MTLLRFDMSIVRELIEHAENSPEHSPTFDQLMDARYRLDRTDCDLMHASPEDVDMSLIPAGLWLVKDHGVYLMANSSPRQLLPNSNTSLAAYAMGYDPDKDQKCCTKSHALSGDDFCEFLPLDMFRFVLGTNRATVSLKVTEDQIAVRMS